jgi:hypothetical protein
MGHEIVLLLTGTINTYSKKYTAVNDISQRRREYTEAIHYYLSRFQQPVVFVENSGIDISGEFSEAIASGKLEILTFNGNDYDAEIGKGLGEYRCMEYAIKHSQLISPESFVFKLTGRYKMKNLAKYIRHFKEVPTMDLMADLTNNFRLSHSSIFGFRPYFISQYLEKNHHLLNDTEGWYFEHVLAKSVLQAIGDRVEFRIIKYYPVIEGISGSLGYRYRKDFFYIFPRQLKYSIRYIISNR